MRTGMPARPASAKEPFKVPHNLCPLRPLHSIRHVRHGHTVRGGQRFRAVAQRPKRQKHFAKTSGRSGRSGRGKVNDSRRVRSGDDREVRDVWSYATGKVYEEERPGAGRVGGLPRLPVSPLSLLSYRQEQTRSGPALAFNYPNERFATEKLFVLYRYSLLSLQCIEIMHVLRPSVGHHWEERTSSILSRSIRLLLALCAHYTL